jgi:hypothetical protein
VNDLIVFKGESFDQITPIAEMVPFYDVLVIMVVNVWLLCRCKPSMMSSKLAMPVISE